MLSEKSAPDNNTTPARQGGNSLLQRIGKSFTNSIGDIVFGMFKLFHPATPLPSLR